MRILKVHLVAPERVLGRQSTGTIAAKDGVELRHSQYGVLAILRGKVTELLPWPRVRRCEVDLAADELPKASKDKG